MPFAMSRNARITAIVAITAVLLVLLAWLTQGFILKRGESIDCGNGDIRRTIDLNDFTTRYWAYSVEFEASLAKRGRLAVRLDPKQLQQLSEAMQQGREFRQFVVAGYNACAITKTQYGDFGAKFQALDGLAKQIEHLAGEEQEDKARLAELVHLYINLSQTLGGGVHPNVAIDASNIGLILLKIAERVYGPDHPNVAIRANNIGQILKDKGDLDGALAFTQRALKIFTQTYGPDNPSTKIVAGHMKKIRSEMKK